MKPKLHIHLHKKNYEKQRKQFELTNYLITCSEGSKLRKRLFPWTTYTNQQRMTTVHSDDAVNDGQVLQSIIKKHQVHSGLIFIKLLQDLLQGSEKKSVITNNKSFGLPSLFICRYINGVLLWKRSVQVKWKWKVKVTWHVTKYGYPYTEFVLCI